MDFLPARIYALQHKLICETSCGQVDDTSTGRLPGAGLLCVWDVHSMPLELNRWSVTHLTVGGSLFICFASRLCDRRVTSAADWAEHSPVSHHDFGWPGFPLASLMVGPLKLL